MKLKIERERKGLWKKRARAISKGLPGLAKQGARTARLHAQRGAMANIYSTERGAYRRTRLFLRSIYAAGEANATSLGLIVGDRANYASFIELGTGPYELTEEQLASYLEVLPRGGLLRFGRSGKAYLLPGPVISPAMQFARTLTRERFVQLMEAVWEM